MSQADHRLNIIVTEQGLTEISSSLNSFGQATTGLVSKQDALATAFGKTQGAAIKTGQEFKTTEQAIAKTGKAADETKSKAGTLGEAFKSSALQITAFASGLVSTIGQFISYQKATSSLERLQAILHTRWIGLEQAEKKLNAQIAAGTISGEDAALASEKLAAKRTVLEKQTAILEQKEQQHTLSLINLATSVIPTVINGISSITTIYDKVRGAVDAATKSTDSNIEATEALGTAAETSTTLGLVPMVKNFAAWITGAKGAHSITTTFTGALQGHGQALTAMGASSNIVVKAFTALGTKIKDFGTAIKVDIGGATGIIDKLKAGFVSFFTNIGSGFSGFGKAIKNAITSLGQIKMASVAAFVTNPAFIAIAGISAVVVALSGNMFGFRDAVNGAGKALGDMAPPLRGVLTWIGEMANAALDAVAGFLGFEKQMDSTGESAEQAAQRLGTLYVATQNVFNTQTTQDVDNLIASLEGMTAEINNLGTTGTAGIDNLGKMMSKFHADIGQQSPKTEQLFRDFQKALNDAKADGVIYKDEVMNIVKVYDQLRDSLHTTIKVEENAVAAQTGVTKSTAEMGDTVAATSKFIDDYETSLKVAEQEFKQFAVAYVQGNDDMIAAMGISDDKIAEYIDRIKKEFPGGAVVIEQFGEKVVTSLDKIKETFGGTSQDITKYIDEMTKAISPTLVDVFAAAQVAVRDYALEQEYLGHVSDFVAAGVMEDSKLWEAAIAAIVQRYPELKLSVEKVRDAFVKAQEDQAKARDKENKGMEETSEKIKTLSETRMEEIQKSKDETIQAQALAKQLGIQTNVAGVTGKGLQQLVQIHDNLTNSTGIAADSVETWYQQLKTSQAIEDATIAKLLELAQKLKIDIPDSAELTVEGLKKIIEESQNMGKAAKENAEKAAAAFGKLANDAAGALTDLIKEDLIAGDIDKVIAKLEEAGTSIDTLAGKQAVIKPILDSSAIDDGLISLTELLDDTWAQATLNAKGGGDSVVAAFNDGVMSQLGELGPPVVAHINSIWEQLKATNPGKTGAELITMLNNELNNPGLISQTANNLGAAIPPGVQSGASGLPGTVNQITNEGLEALFGAGAQYGSAAEEIGTETTAGYQSGVSSLPNEGQAALAKLLDMYPPTKEKAKTLAAGIGTSTGEGLASSAGAVSQGAQTGLVDPINTKLGEVPTGAETAVAPIEGIFSQAFLDASNAAGTQLQTMVTTLHQSMSSMSTSVATYSNSMKTNIANWLLETSGGFQSYKTILTAVQAAFSSLSSNVLTYVTSMSTNIANMLLATSTGFQNYQTILVAIQTAFSTLSTSVATYAASMTSNIANMLLQTSGGFQNYQSILTTVQAAFSTLSTSVATYAASMTSNIANMLLQTSSGFQNYQSILKSVQGAFSTLSSSVATYSNSMKTNIANFSTSAGASFTKVGSTAKTVQTQISSLSTSVSSSMSSMSSKVSSFASSFSSAMSKVKSQADSATKSVKALQSAINSLKSKSITIHVGLSGPGAAYLRHGGAFISPDPTGFAAGGASWINSKPRKIGGVNISEFGKPELVTVTPLSNPGSPTDKTIKMNMNIPKPPEPVPMAAVPQTTTGGGGPIQLTLHTTVAMPDGQVLAKAVNKHLFSNFSGVT